jgi:hypothetical protein
MRCQEPRACNDEAPCRLTDSTKYGRRRQKEPRTERDARGIARGLRALQNRSEGTGNPRHVYLSASELWVETQSNNPLESPPKRVRKGLRRTSARGIRSSQQKKEHKGRVVTVAKWWSGRCHGASQKHFPRELEQMVGAYMFHNKGPSSVAGGDREFSDSSSMPSPAMKSKSFSFVFSRSSASKGIPCTTYEWIRQVMRRLSSIPSSPSKSVVPAWTFPS